MSRLLSEEEYRKTRAFKIKRWYKGEKDAYVGNVEMKPQEPFVEDVATQKKRLHDEALLRRSIYDVDHNKKLINFSKFYDVVSIIFVFVLIGILLYMVSYLPPTGNAANPDNNEVAAKYITDGLDDTGAVNIVTGMILDYRAFDTLGESNVLFIATCTVLILLRIDSKSKKKQEEENDRLYEPKNDIILQKVAFFLVPMIMIFGIYVILNGHLSPGGGFSGGAIIGSGLILYVNAFGFKKIERFFTQKTYKWICFFALSFYCLAKTYSFYCGAHHLETGIPLGTPGAILSSGLILPLNICVGLVVACTMYTFYAMFRKGGF
jgi:multicomponent Na+:H+ antiporter subunit B